MMIRHSISVLFPKSILIALVSEDVFRYINGCYMEDDGTFGDDPMDAANDVLRNYHSRHADARLIIMALTHRNPSRDIGKAAAAIIYDAWIARGNQTDVTVWDELCKRCGA
jgi:hypothetical protein